VLFPSKTLAVQNLHSQACALMRTFVLLSETELFYDCAVTLNVNLCKVSKKVSSMTYHLEKSSSAVMVISVLLEMLIKRVDTACKKRGLYLG